MAEHGADRVGRAQEVYGDVPGRLQGVLRESRCRLSLDWRGEADTRPQFTGDGAARDHEGYYWIRGRVDDVVNVSGHRLSTAEIEAALIEHGKPKRTLFLCDQEKGLCTPPKTC